MKKIGGIHTFEDRAFLRGITRASLAVVAGGVAAAAAWGVGLDALGRAMGVPMPPFELGTALGGLGARLMGVAPGSARFNPLWWVSIALVTVASLAVHELVHGFFFRQYAPAGSRVTFGANLKMGMLYASAEGIIYTRQQYLVIAMAPSIVVTLLLVMVGIGLKWPLWTIIVATAHLSGCTGDWGYVRAILRDPSITHCEDTSWGVEFYGEDVLGLDAPKGNAPLEERTAADATVGDAGSGASVPEPASSGASAAAKGFSVVDGGKGE